MRRTRVGNGVEKLDPRQLAASLVYAIDVFGEDGVQLDVPDGRTVDVGETLTINVLGKAVYEEGELPFGKVGGVFSGGVDLLYNDQTLDVLGVVPGVHFGTAFDNGIMQIGVPVDDIGTSMIDDLGVVASGLTVDQVFTSGGDWVQLASVELLVKDTEFPFTGVSIEADNVDDYYQSLVLGIDEPVEAVMARGDDGNSFWTGTITPAFTLPDMHNEDLPSDVNEDEIVTPLDMLLVVNDQYLHGGRTIQEAVDTDTVPGAKIDVNDDGIIGMRDGLLVMAVLNEQSFTDPDAPTDPQVDPPADPAGDCDIYEKV